MDNQDLHSLTEEFSKSDFGDKRLNSRLVKLSTALLARPSDSFPDATSTVAALEATYRFLGNERVTTEKILAPHIEATIHRASCEERILIAHDKTELLFGGKSRKSVLGWTQQNNQGFYGHFSLALSRTSFVRPLGMLGFQTIFRYDPPGTRKTETLYRKGDPNRESLIWWNEIHRTENLFPFGIKPIHLMDREGDDFESFSEMSDQGIRYVARIKHNRAKCRINGEQHKAKLFDLLDGLTVICQREVPLSKREGSHFPGTRTRHPARSPRIAKLNITAATIEIPRPRASLSPNKTLKVNCIHVYEIDAPKNMQPVDWKLITQEPISTENDILNIIDDYRARWMIEEYFKALKTGCAYEKRQLETQHSLLNALAVFAPIAWQLLCLKTLARDNPQVDAEAVLTKIQIKVLKAVSKKELPAILTVSDAMKAIASLGGHIPNNGPPGWQVLGRGLERLLTMEIAWIAATERCDQS